MTVPFYGHVQQYHNIKTEIDANIQEVLESGQYVMGPMLKRFEKEFAAYHGTKYAIGVGNGTDALWLAFMALGIGPGDECITHPNTFFATAEAIWIAGATAVFVDSDPKTNCIDPSKIEAAITPKTKAIVPVHLYGQCADMKAIRKIADKHKLFVIEDNAQAIGAARRRLQDRRAQRRRLHQLHHPEEPRAPSATAARWSPTTTEIDRVVRRLRNHGSEKRSCHSFGFNSRLDDMHAGVLSAKLKHIDEWNDLRRKWAARYTAGLKDAAQLHAAVRDAGLPPRLPSLRDRDEEARASRPAARISSTRTASTPSATTRSPSTSRKAIRGARTRASPARFRTPSATPPAASRCRCSRN